MRGYFGIGVEGLNKPRNLGALMRTAHAFGAAFVFTLGATYDTEKGRRTDTSKAHGHLPYYAFPDLDTLVLPEGCVLVGVELIEDSVDLPSFHHPPTAAYVLGPEKGSLSSDLIAVCDHVVKIPTRFCLNVGLAGALVMYDRLLSSQRFAPRPMRPGGPSEALPEHRFGGRFSRAEKFRQAPPDGFED